MKQMNDFTYQNTTKIYFGKDQLKNLGNELKKYGSRVLITYGGGSIKKMGLFDQVIQELNRSGLVYFEFGGIEPNPRVESVNKAIAYAREKKIDVLLPIGGGSTIDATKAIASGFYYEGDVWDLWTGKANFTQALPIVTILTLSATGTEMNAGGVISKLSTNEKYGMSNPIMLPKASFLNPENTFTVNKFQTAAGAADMMSHMIEQYFSLESMELMDEITEGIMRTVIHNAPIAMDEPNNYEARANLMWASTWALNGLINRGKSTGWSCHDMEHELSAFYDITHGLGLAILTPKWMHYVLSEENVYRFKRFAIKVFGVEEKGDDMLTAKAGIQALADFFELELELPGTLTAINIDDKHIPEMARKAVDNDKIYGLMTLDAGDVEAIYKMCL